MSNDLLKKGRYTRLSNKIGLVDSETGGFINNSPQVVLNFPFKDTVLEAGMTKEDAGREERFLHTEIDAKDIDTLFDPKVLTDFRYIDKDGERKLTKDDDIEFFDKNGNLKQNLLIKGNNLLALHTLHEKLAGRVKLIYIDPPFFFINSVTQDTFKYNSNFRLSTWLTFMRNRLMIARDLLSNDGCIFIHIDWQGVHYLKMLAEEIFGLDNYQSQIVWRREVSRGRKSEARFFGHNADYILIFTKNSDLASFKPVKKMVELNDDELKSYYHDEKGYFSTSDPGSYSDESLIKLYDDGLIFITRGGEAVIDYDKKTFSTTTGTPRVKYYLIEKDNKYYKEYYVDDIWDDIGGIATKAGERVNFSSQKPEHLIKRIIESTTEPDDIILDYHLGSGTTATVAHKMGRHWIGVEQMDYISTITMKRMRKVIDGEQGGISKDVNWQGGGSFVYFELKKYNQDFIDRIMEAVSIPELEEIYEDMRKNAFLKFWFDKKEFEKDENFRALSIYKRKEALVSILDENQFYLNYDEMEDSKYHVTEDEKDLTNRFYQESDNNAAEMQGADDAEE